MTPGGRESLAQRVETTRERDASRRYGHGTSDLHGTPPAAWADALSESRPASLAPPIKHCWYDGPHGRQAALLLGWRSVEGRYSGRIAVVALEPDGWVIVEMWVDQGMLAAV